jgi:hypothetical protein
MAKCAFCETNEGVGLAVVEAENGREPVSACRSCISEWGLSTALQPDDLPYPNGGGDLQPAIVARMTRCTQNVESFVDGGLVVQLGKEGV